VLTTCQPSTVWCSRERLPAAATQPAKVRQSCSATDYYYYSLTVVSRHVGGRGRLQGDIAYREREPNPFLVLYDEKHVQSAEVSQRRTAVSSKCFQLYYTCSDRLFAVVLPLALSIFFPRLL
jgi:hypothetical protein